MKTLLSIVLMTIGASCQAEVVEVSDFLEIKFVIKGCESRIVHTEIAEVESQDPLGTLSFLEIDPIGMTEWELRLQILNQFESILHSVQFGNGRIETITVKALKSNPGVPQSPPLLIERSRENEDDELCWKSLDSREKARRIELAPKVSSGKMYNKSLKFVRFAHRTWLRQAA